jgi:uncharacterized protein (DUF305 family)
MKTLAKRIIAVLAFAIIAGTAIAQTDHSGHDMGSTSKASEAPATQAYMKAMDDMHETMAKIEYTGDADIDFALGMIPHHQAAIDMAKAQLESGKDPEIRKLSEEIIKAQESEIAQLQAWLKAHQAH